MKGNVEAMERLLGTSLLGVRAISNGKKSTVPFAIPNERFCGSVGQNSFNSDYTYFSQTNNSQPTIIFRNWNLPLITVTSLFLVIVLSLGVYPIKFTSIGAVVTERYTVHHQSVNHIWKSLLYYAALKVL